ncbi:MAG: FG-GAP-like repeat-containing protein [Alphaproteobacteria bacterium]
MQLIKDKHFKSFFILFTGLILACLYFWLSSRYPDLNAKAMMGPDANLSSLGFSPILTTPENAGFWQKVFIETINWADTNKKGMSFAFVAGAFFLSIIPLLKKPRTGNGFIDSLTGLVFGTPLGVCANCAAPIAQSALKAGSSVQFALAMLIASPTMNIVVLMMALTLFPLYLVALKIALTVFFIIILIPLACRYLFQNDVEKIHQQQTLISESENNKSVMPEKWLNAVKYSVLTYLKNFWYLIKIALPLMILAGFLGNLLSAVLPWEFIQGLRAGDDNNALFFLIITGLAIFGAFLPSPIAFDIVLSSTLLIAGVPVYYVAVFLFTLGSFSIYAFLILWKSISLRAAMIMYIFTVLLGIASGIIAYYIHQARSADISTYVGNPSIIDQQTYASDGDYDRVLQRNDAAFAYADLKTQITPRVFKPLSGNDISADTPIEIYATPFTPAPLNTGKKFELFLGDTIGLHHPYEISYISYMPYSLPYASAGLAAGDVHNDGWPDLVMIGDTEIKPNLILYTNINGERFVRQNMPYFGEDDAALYAAVIDFNGDSWPDIFVTTLKGESYILYNKAGEFSPERKKLIHQSEGMAISVSFGDIEGDGDIDIFLGKWNAGPLFINRDDSRNYLLLAQNDGGYETHAIDGITGETLSSLFADFNQDGFLDLYVGNDYEAGMYSDQLFLGQENGMISPADLSLFPGLTGALSTMSVDQGDIDNDLREDYYIAQIAFTGHLERALQAISEKQIRIDDYCTVMKAEFNIDIPSCNNISAIKRALGRITFQVADDCHNLQDEYRRRQCLIHYTSYTRNCLSGSILEKLSDADNKASRRYKNLCNKVTQDPEHFDLSPVKGMVRANSSRSLANILLHNKGEEENTYVFSDIAKKASAAYGAWSWNSRFADLDNDGWQDIYIANGYGYPPTRSMNIFYHNLGNGLFEDKSREFGLGSFSSTTSYALVDYNGDGRQDIISTPFDSPAEIFKSHVKGKAIRFELEDKHAKNTTGIGTKLIIRYKDGEDEKSQMRTIKGSGGYLSFNEPVAHFGMGNTEQIQSLEIHWRDGSRDIINTPLKTGFVYKIVRRAAQENSREDGM